MCSGPKTPFYEPEPPSPTLRSSAIFGVRRQLFVSVLRQLLARIHAVNYPPDDATAQPTIDFSAHVPSFANNPELSNLLQQHGVTIAPAR
jgi:hypothetical protein